jgi:hypothetical protein
MFRATLVALVCVVPPVWADDKPADQLTKGTTWKGDGELADGKVDDRGLRRTDVTVKITDRKGGSLKGEVWVDQGKRGLAFEGTVADGAVEVVFTKPLKGEWAKHWTGRKGTVQTAPDLLSCEFTGSRKTESAADREHFKARLQAK